MGEKIIVGPINKGLRNDRTAFNIDNDSFPTLINAYQWRGRIKRKRGTSLLTRLTRVLPTASIGNSGASPWTINTIYSAYGITPETNASIEPGSVTITIAGPIVFTDQGNGTLTSVTPGNSGTINYITGIIVLTHTAGAGVATTASFNYYPCLPVMGLEDFVLDNPIFPKTLGFDTVYSYNLDTQNPYDSYTINYYKNPSVTADYPNYVPKTTWTQTTWNGQDYQQFWTTNYQNALWATNGITNPFTVTNIGMQFKAITNVAIVAVGPPAQANLAIAAHGLMIGDFVFVNEVAGITGINWQTGYVIAVPGAGNVVVEFPNATLGGAYTSGGIAQYLTNRADTTKDCIRWYDGDPTNGAATAPSFVQGKGWVNFMPPISRSAFSIADLPARIYYLAGARMIVPFKDRLLFIGPVVQASTGNPIYLQDTVVYSQNGTPYYTCSFTGDVSSSATVFYPVLLPTNQTATANSYFSDQTGFGGNVSAGIDQPICTVSSNEDVLIMGFYTAQTRFVYTSNDLLPFIFYLINSELGSTSTFSAINMDRGVLTRGSRGFVISSQNETQRFDLDIPDAVFQIDGQNNGTERMCAQRDFINEWVHFTYPSEINQDLFKFPNQTLQYNYRDATWAVFRECFTTYGIFRKSSGYTWANIFKTYASWEVWNDPWNSGTTNLFQPELIGGNQQGFVLIKGEGTNEGNSLYIKSFSGNVVTSPDHCLNNGDYIIISGCLGTIGAEVNGKIFSVYNVTQDTFSLNLAIGTGTYTGAGLIKRLYIPFIQTKQFPVSWEMSRKTRLGPQQYLLTKTDNSQITLLIYLSQNGSNPYNDSPIVPDPASTNDSLLYSTVLYTCPESQNLGLTAPNTNLQMVTASQQQQIWHRVNTSLLGDTIQLGFSMSDAQMRAQESQGSSVAITGASQAYPCSLLCTTLFSVDTMIKITGVVGMTELNYNPNTNNVYQVLSSDGVNVTINVDSTLFTTYISGGFATAVALTNQIAEIELHSFILEASPSMVLA